MNPREIPLTVRESVLLLSGPLVATGGVGTSAVKPLVGLWALFGLLGASGLYIIGSREYRESESPLDP
jgi:hypothetical protein